MHTAPVFGDQLTYVIAPPNLIAIDPAKQSIAGMANGTDKVTPALARGIAYARSAGSLIARGANTGALPWTVVDHAQLG